MRSTLFVAAACTLVAGSTRVALAQGGGTGAAGTAQAAAAPADDPIRTLVGRLDLERYKATIKGLTQFGDRRQGTDRNRAALDWIEAQLKSYGCTETGRITYEYTGRQLRQPGDSAGRGGRGGRGGDSTAAGRGGRGNLPPGTTPPTPRPAPNPVKGNRARTGVNTNPELQPDTALRRINAQPDTPGQRQDVYCTKVGKTRPQEPLPIRTRRRERDVRALRADDPLDVGGWLDVRLGAEDLLRIPRRLRRAVLLRAGREGDRDRAGGEQHGRPARWVSETGHSMLRW